MPSAASALKTRAKLITSATYLIGRGELDASIQEVASRAGVSVGSLYSHFADKQDLFSQAIVEAAQASFDSVSDDFVDEDPGLSLIAATLFGLYRPELEPDLARILVESGGVTQQALVPFYSALRAMLESSVRLGFAQCDDIDAFVVIAIGTYQALLARIYYKLIGIAQAQNSVWQLARLLGYSHETYAEVIVRVDAAVQVRRIALKEE